MDFKEVERPMRGKRNRLLWRKDFLQTATTGKALLLPFGEELSIRANIYMLAAHHHLTAHVRKTETGIIVWAEKIADQEGAR